MGTGTYNMVWREKHIQIFQDRNYELYITLLKQHYYKDVGLCNLGRIQCSVTYITSAGFTFVLGMLKPLSVIVNTAQKVTNWKKKPKTIVIKNVPICLHLLLKTILKLKLLRTLTYLDIQDNTLQGESQVEDNSVGGRSLSNSSHSRPVTECYKIQNLAYFHKLIKTVFTLNWCREIVT